MKTYIYCMAEDGGMDYFILNDREELKSLPYWMHKICKEEDEYLFNIFDSMEIGDIKYHRLGVLIRLKDS